MANINIDPDQVEDFYNHFRDTTNNMVRELLDIRREMEQIHDSWKDPHYDWLKGFIDETVVRLRNFIDDECQQDLQSLQQYIEKARYASSDIYNKLRH